MIVVLSILVWAAALLIHALAQPKTQRLVGAEGLRIGRVSAVGLPLVLATVALAACLLAYGAVGLVFWIGTASAGALLGAALLTVLAVRHRHG